MEERTRNIHLFINKLTLLNDKIQIFKENFLNKEPKFIIPKSPSKKLRKKNTSKINSNKRSTKFDFSDKNFDKIVNSPKKISRKPKPFKFALDKRQKSKDKNENSKHINFENYNKYVNLYTYIKLYLNS